MKHGIIASAITAAAAAFTLTMLPSASTEAKAVTFTDINDPSVFLKQQEYDTCTLCANVMMLRRTSMMRGDSDWDSITEYSAKPYIWVWGAGMYNNYTFKGITVSYGRIQYDAVTELRELLQEHPEGIVAYDFDRPHAILLTDYTDGEFYCAEPTESVTPGRVNANQATRTISGMDAYWYVESPDVRLTNPVPEKLSNRSVTDRKTVTEGGSITIKGAASGGTGAYKYSYYSRKSGESGWTALREGTNGTSVTFKPSSWGKYEVYIIAEDEKGQSAGKIIDITVVKNLANESSVSASKTETGSSVTLKGKASGGSGKYEYAYYYKKSSGSSWLTIRNYSSSTSAVFKPVSAGDYKLLIKVKDSRGALEKMIFSLTVEKPLKNNSAVSSKKTTVGSEVRLKGAASGGSGKYQFAYYYRKAGSSNWVTIKNYSSDTTVPFKPLSAADYELMIKAKDTEARIEKKTFSLKVIKTLKNNSTVSSKNIKKGSTLIIKGNADGGSGVYEYAFYYKTEQSSQWKLLRDYKSSSNIVFTTRDAGSYRIMVKVRDTEGNLAKKYISITVK